jgi:hypothetical protein
MNKMPKQKVMDRLQIDFDMRHLIREMWQHGYRTLYSCRGHAREGYVIFEECFGDGWFEENAQSYGLKKMEDHNCQHELDPWLIKNNILPKTCPKCGSGLNGKIVYKGFFIPNPLKPDR